MPDIPDGYPTPPVDTRQVTPLPPIEADNDAVLTAEFARIANTIDGNVGVYAMLLETGDSAEFQPDGHFPMQSVYKLPISMAVVEQLRAVARSIWMS